jgi:hypothetical protein
VLGIDNRKFLRLTKISYGDPEAGDITIIWAVNDDVSQNSTKALENNEARFIYVTLIGTVSAQDKYDNLSEIQALNLGFNKSKLDKIN